MTNDELWSTGVCQVCNCVFKFRKNSQHRGKFCSAKCASVGMSRDKHWNWGGGVSHNSKGQVQVSVAVNTILLEHRLICEFVLGRPLPSTVEIHHVDNNAGNNANTNLVVCENRSYHKLLHMRQKVINAGGNPNTDKICYKCKKVKNRNEYHKDASANDKLHRMCKTCTAEYDHASWQSQYQKHTLSKEELDILISKIKHLLSMQATKSDEVIIVDIDDCNSCDNDYDVIVKEVVTQ